MFVTRDKGIEDYGQVDRENVVDDTGFHKAVMQARRRRTRSTSGCRGGQQNTKLAVSERCGESWSNRHSVAYLQPLQRMNME